MRRFGQRDDHGRAGVSLIARIDQAFADLQEIRPDAELYLRRLYERGWAHGEPQPESVRPVVVEVKTHLKPIGTPA